MTRPTERYAGLLARRPGMLLLAVVLVTVALASGASKVETVQQSQEDLLPNSVPAMQAFNTINAEFDTTAGTTYTILVRVAPSVPNSTEVRDIRDPRALRFMDAVADDLAAYDAVTAVSSPTDLFDDIPSSTRQVQQALAELPAGRWQQYISPDYRAALIRATTTGLTPEEQLQMADLISQTVTAHDRPAGLEVGYTGQPYIDQAFQRQTQRTMGVTGTAALLGVMLVVVLLFRSLFYGLTSLLTLVFGITTGFGIFGWLGMNMSPATSGALSMGIGVAIDFGIQPIARYIEEREQHEIQQALAETLQGVITPMTVGLIAANIGFLSLSVGRVTFLSSLGILLTLTTTMAYLAALTVIPAAMVLYDRYFTGDEAQGFTLSAITNG